MQFFRLHTLGNLNDPDLCRANGFPQGIGLRKYCMALGDRATPFYPKDPKIFLKEEDPGIRLTSLLGNTNSYLIACSEMKEVITSYSQNIEVEYLPFDLYDHRKRLYSRDYFIINPIGSHDCLDEKASGVEYGPEGSVVHIAQLVLDAAKLNKVPPFFRIDKQRTTYVVSEPLAQALKDHGFTNVQLEPLAISASA